MFINGIDVEKNACVCVCVFALQGNCPKVSSINDRSDWKVVRKALSVIGFSDDEVEVRGPIGHSCRVSEINFIPKYLKEVEEMYSMANATHVHLMEKKSD